MLYVADLDALTGGEPQHRPIAEIAASLVGIDIWLDGGFSGLQKWSSLLHELGAVGARISPVFASEALASRSEALCCLADRGRAILSLDRLKGDALDAAGCWNAPELWPDRVIVMTLDRVGSDSGPDLECLREVRRMAPDVELIGAGGIRNAADLLDADEAGARAWLVASALHERRLPTAWETFDAGA